MHYAMPHRRQAAHVMIQPDLRQHFVQASEQIPGFAGRVRHIETQQGYETIPLCLKQAAFQAG
jgi:hypothetical protein